MFAMDDNASNRTSGFVAGWFGGCVATIVSHPADTIKVRMQMEGAKQRYQNSLQCLLNICKTESIRGLFKGMAYPLCSQLFINATVFGCENVIFIELQPQGLSGARAKAVSGAVAGAVQCLIVCPAELIKIRMQNQGVGQSYGIRAIGPWSASKQLYREQGVAGFYRGWWLTMAREVPQYALYFSACQYSKEKLADTFGPPKTQLQRTLHSALSGGFAGVVTWLWYPVDVVKTRFQNDTSGKYKGIMDCYSKLVSEGGHRMLFAGIMPTLVRGFINGVATFATVDFVKTHWDSVFSGSANRISRK